MCTLIILRRPGHDWPVLIATNRDEMASRPWLPPARHWPDRPGVVAGMDALAGGTWLGINDAGLAAAILNRKDSLGPDPSLRSRGELVLEALDHTDAAEAAEALAHLRTESYRSFNMIVADNRDAWWLNSRGSGAVAVTPVPDGLNMITAYDLNDHASPRTRYFLPRFREAAVPDAESGDWAAWIELLGSRDHAPEEGPGEAMTIVTDFGFGTLSSSLIALPAMGRDGEKPRWRFANGAPDRTEYGEVSL